MINSNIERYKIEADEEWRKWCLKIPSLSFDSDWKVQIIPPYTGAMARFVVTKGSRFVDVYLDVYDNLGYVGRPYWEIYPSTLGRSECQRFFMEETDDLINAIRNTLECNEIWNKDGKGNA